MKTASPALVAFLNSLRPDADAALIMADLFTITLASGSIVGVAAGTQLRYTDIDFPVLWGGQVYLSSGPQISGLKYKGSIGVNVDSQKMTVSAWPSDMVGGVTFLQAVQQGLLDGAEVQREKAFFSSMDGPYPATPVGTVVLFKGRVTSIDQVGRTTAQITVASDMTLLAVDMPRNIYSPSCNNVLYDSGCGLSRGAFTVAGVVGAGSTTTVINWSSATVNFQQGAVTFTGGANTGIVTTVKVAGTGSLGLSYPLPEVPAVGDTFTAVWGCDHTQATCLGKFANMANYRGFPYVPPPQIITGPLATHTPVSRKSAKL